MVISFAFLIVTALKVLLVLGLSKESTQAERIWRRKELFGNSIASSLDPYNRLVSTYAKRDIQASKLRPVLSVDESDFGNKESIISTSLAKSLHHRSKRVVYSHDERREVPPRLIEKCPFSSAVMISTGCSGVLVSPKHVLTSAHCLHNGSHYVDGYKSLRVGFLLKNGTTDWRAIRSTKLPKQWKNGSDPSATQYDYALITLSRNHSRCFLPIAPSKMFFHNTACAHRAIHITAFDEDRGEGTMLYRTCRVITVSSNMLFHCCDATAGSSGSGAYEIHRDKHDKKKSTRYVIGVFSGNRDHVLYNLPRNRRPTTCSGRARGYVYSYRYQRYFYRVNFNAVKRFKESDVYHLCTWMRRFGGKNCKRFLKERLRRQRKRKRRERHRDARCHDVF